MQQNLNTERFQSQLYKDLFLKYNKEWLKDHLQEVFTPRTLYLHRQKIIDNLAAILPEEKARIEREENDAKYDSG